MAGMTEKDLPDRHRSTWLKASSAMQLKNYGYVIQLTQTILRQVPDFLAARRLLRKAAIARPSSRKSLLSSTSFAVIKAQGLLKKDPFTAVEAIEKILEEEPFNVHANLLLRDAALAANMPETAAFAMETLAEGYPRDPKILHDVARVYTSIDQRIPDLGYAEKAVAIYNRILEISPNDIEAIKSGKDAAARASLQKGGWEREGATYRDLIRDKDVAVSLEQKGRVVRSKEVIEQQLVELGRKYAQNPEHIDTVRQIAELYEQYANEARGDREMQDEAIRNSISYYQYAAQLTAGADSSLLRKASELTLKQYDLFIEDCENFIAADSDSDGASVCRQQLLEARKQRSQLLLEDARKRVERNPTDLQFRFELAEILVDLGNYQEAIPELQRAKNNPSLRLRAMNLLGKTFEARNMLDLGAKTFEEAAREIPIMDSTKKELVYNLGLVYEKMQSPHKMLECMKSIYEVDYGYKDVAQRVESSYQDAD